MPSLFTHHVSHLLLFSVLLPLSFLHITHAADIEQVWNVSYHQIAPDGIPKFVPLINGQFPGPSLRGHVGQTVRIIVHNQLPTTSISIHFHGIKHKPTASLPSTIYSDGKSPLILSFYIFTFISYIFNIFHSHDFSLSRSLLYNPRCSRNHPMPYRTR